MLNFKYEVKAYDYNNSQLDHKEAHAWCVTNIGPHGVMWRNTGCGFDFAMEKHKILFLLRWAQCITNADAAAEPCESSSIGANQILPSAA